MSVRSRFDSERLHHQRTSNHVKLPSVRARGQQGIADPVSSARAMRPDDRRLGMDRPIARRDFLNGVAVAAGAIAGGMLPCATTEGQAYLTSARGLQSGAPPLA